MWEPATLALLESSKAFTARIVLHLRRAHGLPSHADRLRSAGMLTQTEIAERLAVRPRTVKCWASAGLIMAHVANDKNERLYEPPSPGDPRLVKQLGRPLSSRVLSEPTARGAV